MRRLRRNQQASALLLDARFAEPTTPLVAGTHLKQKSRLGDCLGDKRASERFAAPAVLRGLQIGRGAQAVERCLEDWLEVTGAAVDRGDGDNHVEHLLERDVVADFHVCVVERRGAADRRRAPGRTPVVHGTARAAVGPASGLGAVLVGRDLATMGAGATMLAAVFLQGTSRLLPTFARGPPWAAAGVLAAVHDGGVGAPD